MSKRSAAVAADAVRPGDSLEDESRTRALHRATLSLYSDLSLQGVLERVVHAARDLGRARYAALGIPDGQGGLQTFITLGMSDAERARIPHPPEGRGLIGEMMRTGNSIRLPEIAGHPAAVGFPPEHPRMHSFLGVPIAAYGRSIGQIYLADKIGALEFSEDDQRLIELLAAHAAAAIENARLYGEVIASQAQLAQRNEELGLINTMTSAVGSSMDLDRLLDAMLERVIEQFEAAAGEIFLREEGEAAFRLAVHRGQAPEAFWSIDRFRSGEGVIGRVGKTGQPYWTNALASDPAFMRQDVLRAGFGSLVAVPLTGRGQVLGVISLAFRGARAFDAGALGLLEAVGTGIGIAVENARLYRQARRLAVLEERERIGMDLHDGIIQSIYAVGLTLEYTRMLVREEPEGVEKRMEEAIDGLNAVIRDIRSYILDLQPARYQSANLADGLGMLVREFKANTLTEAELQVDPEALEALSVEATNTLFHIAQEALANTGKHAQATRVLVSLQREDSRLLLRVIDNGRGFDMDQEPRALGHGLSNMRERARQAGGELMIGSSAGEGTTVTVELPALLEPAPALPYHPGRSPDDK